VPFIYVPEIISWFGTFWFIAANRNCCFLGGIWSLEVYKVAKTISILFLTHVIELLLLILLLN